MLFPDLLVLDARNVFLALGPEVNLVVDHRWTQIPSPGLCGQASLYPRLSPCPQLQEGLAASVDQYYVVEAKKSYCLLS